MRSFRSFKGSRAWCAGVALLLVAGAACQRDEGVGTDAILARLEKIDARLARLEDGAASAAQGVAVSTPAAASGSVAPAAAGSGSPLAPDAAPAARVAPSAVDPRSARDPRSAVDAASAVVAARSYDFGTVWSGPAIEHVFRVANDGDEPFDLLAATPSCTCLTVGDYARRVDPGVEIELPVSLDTTRIKGQVRQTVVLRTSDAQAAEIELSLSGVIRSVVEYESFVLLRVRPGEGPQERRIKIRYQQDGAGFQPRLIERPKDRFEVRLEETVPGKESDLVVRVEPPFAVGYEHTTVQVETGLAEPARALVRINLHIPDRLDVVPSQLLVDDRAGNAVARQLTLSNYGDSLVHVLGAEVDDPQMQAIVAPREIGKVYAITVSLPAGHRLPASGRTLRLRTDDAEKPVVEVPIRSLATPVAAATTGNAASGTPPARPAMALVDKPAPGFALTTIGGLEITRETLDEHPATVINFFAPNCGYCKRQLPLVEKLRAAYEDRGVRFVNVREVMGVEFSLEQTEEALALLGVDLELALDAGNQVGALFRVTGFPTLFLVDKEGTVKDVVIGARQDLETSLGGKLDDLLR